MQLQGDTKSKHRKRTKEGLPHMAKRLLGITAVLLLMLSVAVPMFAQESSVRGTLAGAVVDSSGAVIVGAKVTAVGASDTRTAETDKEGHFTFAGLHPGFFSLTVTKEGFKSVSLKSTEVTIGLTKSVQLTMSPGAVTETIEVSATAVTIDTASTSVGASLPDSFFHSIPMARNVSSVFYIAPGVTDGGGTGRSNPSISGASGLENMYVADGVNITDSAFGGLGVYTPLQGSVGSGINLSFIKEVSVKTSGLEPQYGQATGGVVTMVTKSGGNAFHGELGGYFAPQQFEATRNQIDDVRTNKVGYNPLHQAAFEFDGELGGYVPGFKNHLFFFGSFDPTFNQNFVRPPVASNLFKTFGEMRLMTDVRNYAGKLTWKLSDKHQIESSVFGDPSHTTTGQNDGTLNRVNNAAFSKWVFGTRNLVVRYNGTMSPTWLVNASFSWNNNKFTESPLHNALQITDNTSASNVHGIGGLGFLENHDTDDYALNFDTSKVAHALGQHTLSFGYRYERPKYTNINAATGVPGGTFTVPTVNATGGTSWLGACAGVNNYATCPGGQQAIAWGGSLITAPATCTLCPFYPLGGTGALTRVYVNFTRGRWDTPISQPYGRYHAAYANDSWELNKHITINAGLRWEQWRMAGTNFQYTFTDNWAPRVGISVDPVGDRKTKIYSSFGRYNYQTPLDAAIRSLSSEKDVFLRFAPVSNAAGNVVINGDGSINMALDAAHLLNKATGGLTNAASIAANPIEAIAPGTKMMYQNEWVVGAEHQFKSGVVVSGRFIYRNMPRIVEDVAGVSPEAYVAGLNQNYLILNPSTKTDAFPNEKQVTYASGATPPAACGGAAATYSLDPLVDNNGAPFGPAGQAVCWAPLGGGLFGGELTAAGLPIPDGKPEGFVNPIHLYKAVEIEVAKAFANNWMLRANWRIAKLVGNYEGAYRNDNGQSDPNISSLFDFTAGNYNLLGQQFASGVLPTDRRHIVNAQVTYVFSHSALKGLELGTGVRLLTGTPVTNLGNHPAYANAGEIPLGGRGALGRTPFTGQVDVHVERPFRVTEKSTLRFAVDMFNIANSKPVSGLTLASQIGGSGLANPDFLAPNAYQRPFYARMSVRWVF